MNELLAKFAMICFILVLSCGLLLGIMCIGICLAKALSTDIRFLAGIPLIILTMGSMAAMLNMVLESW